MPPLVPAALVVGGVAALLEASRKAMAAQEEAAASVGEAAGPFVAAAFVLCLLGALVGSGRLKPTHLSEDPAYRCKDLLESRAEFAVLSPAQRGACLKARRS